MKIMKQLIGLCIIILFFTGSGINVSAADNDTNETITNNSNFEWS